MAYDFSFDGNGGGDGDLDADGVDGFDQLLQVGEDSLEVDNGVDVARGCRFGEGDRIGRANDWSSFPIDEMACATS